MFIKRLPSDYIFRSQQVIISPKKYYRYLFIYRWATHEVSKILADTFFKKVEIEG